MSKVFRDAIKAELLALYKLVESETATAQEVLNRLCAHTTVAIFEKVDRYTVLAEDVARGQQASLAELSACEWSCEGNATSLNLMS